jgi:hypothetical protein
MLQQINIGWLADEAMAHFYVTWTNVWNALHVPIGNQIMLPLIGRSTFLSNTTILQMQGQSSRSSTDILRICTHHEEQ